jgi:hypothetical protein
MKRTYVEIIGAIFVWLLIYLYYLPRGINPSALDCAVDTTILVAILIPLYVMLRNKRFSKIINSYLSINKIDICNKKIDQAIKNKPHYIWLRGWKAIISGFSGSIRIFAEIWSQLQELKPSKLQQTYRPLCCLQNAMDYLCGKALGCRNFYFPYSHQNQRICFLMNDMLLAFEDGNFIAAKQYAKDLANLSAIWFCRSMAASVLSELYLYEGNNEKGRLYAIIAVEIAPTQEMKELLQVKHRMKHGHMTL